MQIGSPVPPKYKNTLVYNFLIFPNRDLVDADPDTDRGLLDLSDIHYSLGPLYLTFLGAQFVFFLASFLLQARGVVMSP